MDFLKRKFPAYVDTGLNLVDVKECAEGHLLAMEKAVPGERYILGGENLTLKQILDKLAAITGLPSPTIKLPYAVAYATGVVDTLVTGTIRQREPRVTLDSVRMGRKKMFVSSAKAEHTLGMESGPGGWGASTSSGLVQGERLCPVRLSRLWLRCGASWPTAGQSSLPASKWCRVL